MFNMLKVEMCCHFCLKPVEKIDEKCRRRYAWKLFVNFISFVKIRHAHYNRFVEQILIEYIFLSDAIIIRCNAPAFHRGLALTLDYIQ